MNLTLKVWRQKSASVPGGFETYEARDIIPDMSFLEMLDVVNEGLIASGREPIAFDSDCREGICGTCSLVINGVPHGGHKGTTACQLHMRHFHDGQTITVEPWRARPFPVLRDLVVDRTPFDRIIQAGGFVSVSTGGAPDANAIPIAKRDADKAMDAAACIGCGACVAACKNASAMLFVAAKVSHLGLLPQGQPGCSLLAAPDLVDVLAPGAGTVSSTLALANDPALIGLPFYAQTIPCEFDLTGNIAAFRASNALAVQIGSW